VPAVADKLSHARARAAVITIAAKFLLRWRGKHLFNPTNFGLVAMMLATDGRVWVSPGQWGNVAFFGFLMACLGGLVVMRAARSDVTFAFAAAISARLRALALARRADRDPASPLAKRRPAAVHVFHDQRSEDDA